jgi:hypothetical protein
MFMRNRRSSQWLCGSSSLSCSRLDDVRTRSGKRSNNDPSGTEARARWRRIHKLRVPRAISLGRGMFEEHVKTSQPCVFTTMRPLLVSRKSVKCRSHEHDAEHQHRQPLDSADPPLRRSSDAGGSPGPHRAEHCHRQSRRHPYRHAQCALGERPARPPGLPGQRPVPGPALVPDPEASPPPQRLISPIPTNANERTHGPVRHRIRRTSRIELIGGTASPRSDPKGPVEEIKVFERQASALNGERSRTGHVAALSPHQFHVRTASDWLSVNCFIAAVSSHRGDHFFGGMFRSPLSSRLQPARVVAADVQKRADAGSARRAALCLSPLPRVSCVDYSEAATRLGRPA